MRRLSGSWSSKKVGGRYGCVRYGGALVVPNVLFLRQPAGEFQGRDRGRQAATLEVGGLD